MLIGFLLLISFGKEIFKRFEFWFKTETGKVSFALEDFYSS